MKKINLIFLLFSLAAIYIIMSSHANGMASQSNDDRTGAPNAGLCTDCHGGGAFGTVIASIQVFAQGTTTAVTSYQPGTLYDVRVTITKGAGAPTGYGFEFTCLTTPGNAPLAGYSNLASNIKQKAVTTGTYKGRTYTEHNGVTSNNVFNFSWTAPTAGTGSVKFYTAGIAANVNNSSSGDNGGNTTLTLPEATPPLTVSGVTTNVLCFGGSTGAINITATGGTTPYTYNWGTVTTEDRTNLIAGVYNVTVKDNANGSATATFNITQPTAALSAPGTVTNVLCFGGNTGAITLSTAGGTSPYTYDWGGGISTQNRTTLTAGNYTVTVTDKNSCTTLAPFTVTQPNGALSASGTVTNVACFGGSTGAITLTPTGGTTPYTYNWGGGVTTQNRTSLAASNYSVTVTDKNSCNTSATFTIGQPVTALAVTGSKTDVLCFGGATGTINITASGGTAPYTYNWAGNITSEDRTTLSAGNYPVTVRDNNHCTTSNSFTITEPQKLNVSHTEGTILCFGGSTAITVAATGGVSPYTSTGIFTVQAGMYNYTVTDNNQCTGTTSDTITQPGKLTANAGTITISCNGDSGTINVSANGGTPPYSSVGGFTINTPGSYPFVVTDSNGCTANTIGTALSSNGLSDSIILVPPSCNGLCNGSIAVIVSGGIAPYTFIWSDSTSQQNHDSLCAGSYQQIITDSTGCSLTNNFTLPDVALLRVTLTNDSIFCFADSSQILSKVSGGTSPYTYNWNTGDTINNIKTVAGSYTLSVNDNHNCSASSSITLNQPDSINASLTVTANAINITLIGGTNPYHFEWSNQDTTQNVSQLSEGIYGVTITDANGCSNSINNIAILSTGTGNLGLTNEVKIYPNPVRDELFLHLPIMVNENAQVNIFTIEGVLAKSMRVSEADSWLDVSALPSALYIFEVFTVGGRTERYRVLKTE